MIRALINGFAGACALTVAHEVVRKTRPNAPRLDILGMRSVAKLLSSFGVEPPEGARLRQFALVSDLVSNTIFFAGVGAKPGLATWVKGINLGLGMGVGAITVPKNVGLGKDSDLLTKRTTATAVTTVGLYVLAGLTAAAVAQMGRKK
ncbi:MAG TPA: hypothetical protein V6C76_13205 [Drouetiella sp.]